MKFSHGSKFDSRKPAAARFVAIASSCTDLRSIHSLSLSLCFFLRVRHVGWGSIDSSKALIFNRIFARRTRRLVKVKVRRSSSFVWSRLIDRCSISKKKKKGIFFLEFPIYVAVYEKFEQRDSNCGHCCPLGARWKWRMEKRHSEVKV